MKLRCLVCAVLLVVAVTRGAHAQVESSPPPAAPPDPAAALTSDSVRTSWVLRFGGGVYGLTGFHRDDGGSLLAAGTGEYYTAHLLTGRLYLLTGGSVILGKRASRRCTVAECAQKDDPNVGESDGFGALWGPAASLVFKLAPGREYLAVWLPEIRIQHLLTHHANHNDACVTAFGKRGCSGWSFENLALTAGIGLELAHGDGMSCGVDIAMGWTLGDLPGRNEGLRGDYAAGKTLLVNIIYNYDKYVPILR